ncbi:MAG TPA: aspartyl protease family protein [Candidatus Acidoferrales bacterium]|nr:aspartyl protease family protein [Candidatus Acidoferrales bacterium]
MFSRFHPILISILAAILFRLAAVDDNAKAPAPDPNLAAADQLFQAGKFAEAETRYQAIVQNDVKIVPAQVGLVRSMLKQQKIDESVAAVNKALMVAPDSAALLAVKGDVQFRRGEMAGAEVSYLRAKVVDPKEVRTYLGLARLYSSYSLYRRAYDFLQTAHTLAPADIEVQRAWLRMLPRKERLAALKEYLAGPHPDDPEETGWMQEYLDFLNETVGSPVHACRLVSKVEQTETKLEVMYGSDGHRMTGIGLSVNLNDHRAHLLLDTGAGGIMVSRKVAEKAGLSRISAAHYGGIGDKGLQEGYTAVADRIRIGELEFQDCVVSVSERRSIADEDGLVGADVFGAYLVDLDLPGMKLKLSPLPKRPEDAVAPKSLNSEGEDQANAERREESATDKDAKQLKGPESEAKAAWRLPKDRYIPPEMANWTKVFRFGHMVLVPTFVNDSPSLLFGLDTGAFANVLSLREGQLLGKVSSEDRLHVRGLNGEVNKVYSAKATLRFAHLQQPSMDIVTFDLSPQSRRIGTEVSGFLGFAMLRVLEVKLDYRDGLVDFEYDPKRVSTFSR